MPAFLTTLVFGLSAGLVGRRRFMAIPAILYALMLAFNGGYIAQVAKIGTGAFYEQVAWRLVAVPLAMVLVTAGIDRFLSQRVFPRLGWKTPSKPEPSRKRVYDV